MRATGSASEMEAEEEDEKVSASEVKLPTLMGSDQKTSGSEDHACFYHNDLAFRRDVSTKALGWETHQHHHHHYQHHQQRRAVTFHLLNVTLQDAGS